jgi:hypothetical protein
MVSVSANRELRSDHYRERRLPHHHWELRPAVAVPHRYRELPLGAADQLHHKELLLGAAVPRQYMGQREEAAPQGHHRELRLVVVAAARNLCRELVPAAAVSHHHRDMLAVAVRRLLDMGKGAFHPSTSCRSQYASRKSGSSERKSLADRLRSLTGSSRAHHKDPRRSSVRDEVGRLHPQ